MSTNENHSSFKKASSDFKRFLAAQGTTADVHWLFQEDVISRDGKTLIRVPIPSQNIIRAEACYELGWKKNLGVELRVFCLLNGRPCGWVQLPLDARESELMLMAPGLLKFTVNTDLRDAVPVTSVLRWQMLKLGNTRSQLMTFDLHIPSTKTLLPEPPHSGAGAKMLRGREHDGDR